MQFVKFTLLFILVVNAYNVYITSEIMQGNDVKSLVCILQQGNIKHVYKCTKSDNIVTIDL